MTAFISCPASDAAGQRNFKASVLKGVRESDLRGHVSDAEFAGIAQFDKPFRVWGLRSNPNNFRAWTKLSIGDIALFYSSKAYRFSAIVSFKWQDFSLSPLPGHETSKGELFPLKFLVTDLRECFLSIDQYNDLRGYKPGYYPADPHVGSGDDAEAVLSAIDRSSSDDELQLFLSSEGKRQYRRNLAVERRASNRKAVLALRGFKCQGCNFLFRDRYGDDIGDYAEVHHLTPLSLGEQLAPTADDFAVLCANCHRAVHKLAPLEPLSVASLRQLLSAKETV